MSLLPISFQMFFALYTSKVFGVFFFLSAMKSSVEQASFSHSGTQASFKGVHVFSTVRIKSCTDMENIQAINASMPV